MNARRLVVYDTPWWRRPRGRFAAVAVLVAAVVSIVWVASAQSAAPLPSTDGAAVVDSIVPTLMSQAFAAAPVTTSQPDAAAPVAQPAAPPAAASAAPLSVQVAPGTHFTPLSVPPGTDPQPAGPRPHDSEPEDN